MLRLPERLPVRTALALLLAMTSLSCRMTEQPHPLPPAKPKQLSTRCQDPTLYFAGAGVSDVTGPAAETRMFGYADLAQETRGIHTRLHARAFAFADPCSGKRAVFVSTDLLGITQAVKHRVTERLRAVLGETYTDENVMLTATHTHSGPGGYSHYMLYNMTIFGFDPQNFEAIVEGIVEAILQADGALAPARLSVEKGELVGASINRSPRAYLLNPPEERARYAHDVDTETTLLRIDGEDGLPLGAIHWFPVHTTSMGPMHHLISSDNKGWASDHFERAMRKLSPHFIAAFANSNEGDASPNLHGGMTGEGADDFESTAASGRRQLEAARSLFDSATSPFSGPLDVRHTWVKFDQLKVAPRWTDGKERNTCVAALGVSMIAGAEDGPGVIPEGQLCDRWQGLPDVPCTPFKRECQAEKPVLLEMGSRLPYPWSPDILPLQILRVGPLALVGVPFELTTMSGRRLRQTVREALSPVGVEHVVIAGLANSYAGYIATREEYAAQHYEGASTHFGPWTLAALQQEIHRLAEALRDGAPVERGPEPRDLTGVQHTLQTSVVFDDTPPGIAFGDVHHDVAPHVAPGGVVRASFWGAHPKNDFRRKKSFLFVDQQRGDTWAPIATDADWETVFRWTRAGCLGCSHVTAEWRVPEDVPAGTYRLRVGGEWKSLYGGVRSFEGISSTFDVGRAEVR